MIPIATICHHEGAENGLNSVNEWHKQRWNGETLSSLGWYIGYHYYIDRAGKITQTRSEDEIGAHCLGGWNSKSIGICCMGNFNMTTLTTEQENALSGLIEAIQFRHEIGNDKIYTHGELWPTECPGKNLQTWVSIFRENDLTYYQQKILQLKSLIEELKLKLKIT